MHFGSDFDRARAWKPDAFLIASLDPDPSYHSSFFLLFNAVMSILFVSWIIKLPFSTLNFVHLSRMPPYGGLLLHLFPEFEIRALFPIHYTRLLFLFFSIDGIPAPLGRISGVSGVLEVRCMYIHVLFLWFDCFWQ